MPTNPKLKQIYDTLKEGGADVGSEKEFNDYFQANGKDGYNNRKQVYDTLKEGGADVGKSYEEFAGWLGLHAVNSKPATPRHTVQAAKPAPARPVRTQPTGLQQPKGKPMTAAEKAGMISSVGGIVRSTQAGLQRTQNMMTYARGKAGLHAKPAKLGQHSNVVETARRYNPKTGKMQPHYLTEADKAAAIQMQADAEARLDKWVQISNVNKARKQAELNRINVERAEAERVAREKAVAELAEQKRIEAEKKAEQESIGAHAVNPKIKEKWNAAPKIVNNFVNPNIGGEKLHYRTISPHRTLRHRQKPRKPKYCLTN